MSEFLSHASHMPCPECGASVAAGDETDHVCEAERLLDYRMFQLADEVASFESALHSYLATPLGRFAQWLAERER